MFADHFEQQFTNNPTINPDKDARIARVVQLFKEMPLINFNMPEHLAQIREISLENVKESIKNLNIKKAPGTDGVRNISLKNLPEKTLKEIKNISQAILIHGHFPEIWKQAKIVLIPKKGQPATSVASYRPISLLSCLGKVTESLILKRINDFIFERNLLPNIQFGFRNSHCTTRQTTRLASDIAAGFNKRHHIGSVFLDISKAFDRVWHDGLILKILRASFPHYLTKVICSYLENRSFIISSENMLSSIRSIKAGVPQGSPLAPTLYNIYTADFPTNQHTKSYLFADDTAITASSRRPEWVINKLQTHINTIEKWMNTWRIRPNDSKTQAILFSKSRLIQNHQKIKVNNTNINWSNTIRYLGLDFDKKMTWEINLNNRIKKANTQFRILYPLFAKNSKINLMTKVNLYKIMVRPILTFGAPTWCTMTRTRHKKLQVAQNKILRTIVNAPRYTPLRLIHRELNIETIQEFLTKIITSYYKTTDTSTNPLITSSHLPSPRPRTHRLPRDWLPP